MIRDTCLITWLLDCMVRCGEHCLLNKLINTVDCCNESVVRCESRTKNPVSVPEILCVKCHKSKKQSSQYYMLSSR